MYALSQLEETHPLEIYPEFSLREQKSSIYLHVYRVQLVSSSSDEFCQFY